MLKKIDVHNLKPDHEVELGKVGIEGFKRIINIKGSPHDYHVLVTINSYITLPSNQKGAHMSRFIESINSISNEVSSINSLAEKISINMLKIHGFNCEIEIIGELPFKKIKPNREEETAIAKIFTKFSTKNNKSFIGISLNGVLACPCSKELTNGLTHNQRGELTVELDATNYNIEPFGIIDTGNKSFSSPTFSLLKRPEEKQVVEKIHQNPKFVEDTTRKCVTLLKEKYSGRHCKVKSISFESIHDYNTSAEWKGIL